MLYNKKEKKNENMRVLKQDKIASDTFNVTREIQ